MELWVLHPIRFFGCAALLLISMAAPSRAQISASADAGNVFPDVPDAAYVLTGDVSSGASASHATISSTSRSGMAVDAGGTQRVGERLAQRGVVLDDEYRFLKGGHAVSSAGKSMMKVAPRCVCARRTPPA